MKYVRNQLAVETSPLAHGRSAALPQARYACAKLDSKTPLKLRTTTVIDDEIGVVAGQVKTFPQNIHVASKLICARCVPASVFFSSRAGS
ncbi:hypothetical protein [Bradyrhizobium sp. RDM4]|uniref:hypothetical protein n=1 Tax=Bradyrhizobium sp. RDM4 TaxID=3378765 RepID=UPI0038FBECC0